MHWFLNFIFWNETLHVSDSSSVHPARRLSANLYDINHCCVYSEKLDMDRGTVRNMQSFIPKNKFEK